MEVKGNSPDYVAETPENFLLRYLSWPDEDGRQAAIQKMGESEIAFGIMGFNPNMVAANVATSNEEELVLAEQYAKEIVGPGICVVIAGNSPRDFAYKKAVLEQIIEDTKATSLKAVEEGDVQIASCGGSSASPLLSARPCGPRGCSAGRSSAPTPTRSSGSRPAFAHRQEGPHRHGLVYPDNVDPFITSLEQGQLTHSEVLLRWTPAPDVAVGAMEYVGKANASTVNGHHGLPHHLFGDIQHDYFGPHSTNYTYWLRRIKKSFDPNGVSEASNHITAKDV